ncbi:MAG TPA: ADP-glyceromanno-heptose 6-epimerase [Burkholderiales bacterium]|nr:ADP-glyceromanno-heptose 6-epimerase [Burkholderiales bacterium]
MAIVVTGAAGFIGSRLIGGLNRNGVTDIVAVDNLAQADKFRNLAGCEIADYLDQAEFLERIDDFSGSIEAVFHQGANSNTMETDGRLIMETNYRYSVRLLAWCQDEEVPLLYASSAAVYGAGPEFREERRFERPLNVYGYSKFLFDQYVRRILPGASAQVVGLRYFNVYGPNESHKGRMASVAYHAYNQFQADGKVKLFVGSGGFGDGEQRRDFVHVDDAVSVNLWMLEHPRVSGIFNCGTGRAQTFNDVAAAVINTVRGSRSSAQELAEESLIQYVPFPRELVDKYQSYTQADLTRLRGAGLTGSFMTVEEGVSSYVRELMK